jgi:uncharacterized membrane protein
MSAGVRKWENLRRREPSTNVNVGRRERWISAVAAAAVAAYGLRRRRGRTILLPIAGALIGRAVSGRCPVNEMLGRNSALGDEPSAPVTSVRRGQGVRVDETVVLNRARGEVYRFWRNLENLPRFMSHLESVERITDTLSRWRAEGPAGATVEWNAEIINEVESSIIGWRSIEGSDVVSAGSVHFEPAGPGRTLVRVRLQYSPPGGKAGAAIAKLMGKDAATEIREDLMRFKQMVESGVST